MTRIVWAAVVGLGLTFAGRARAAEVPAEHAAAESAQAPAAPGAEASFLPPGGTSLVIRFREKDGRQLLAVNDVVAALGGSVTYDAENRSFEVKLQQHSIVFGTETPIVVADTKLVQLAVPVTGDGATAYADLEFFQKALGPLQSLTFAFDRASRMLSAYRTQVPEIAIETSVAELDSVTKIVFRFSQPPSYHVEKPEGQVVLRFTGARLVTGTPERSVDDVRVSRVVVRGNEAAVFLKQKDLATNVYSLGSPPRIVVDVSRPMAAAAPGPTPARPEEPPRKRIVVLDPGHGGTEEGARGPEGLLEKDATLALVRKVREVLTRRGYQVVTTRDSDATVGLEDRASSANAAHADVFLSIHCNASRTATAHGTEVYYLSLDATDRAAAALAESENRIRADEPATPTPSAEANAALRELDLILWDLAQNQHLAASARLSEIIQADFDRLLGVTSRGVKQAPFKVLIGVNAPAVLVEVAFVTNPDEEKKLASEEFRQVTAETLAGSLDRFFTTADGVGPVPYAPGPRN